MNGARIGHKCMSIRELSAFSGQPMYECSNYASRLHVVLELGPHTVDYLDLYVDEASGSVDVFRSVTSRIQWDHDLESGVIRLRKPGHDSCNSVIMG